MPEYTARRLEGVAAMIRDAKTSGEMEAALAHFHAVQKEIFAAGVKAGCWED